jgi:hypothetical protein
MDRQKKESPNFYVFIISDIKNGLVVKDTTYGMEIKEVYYYQDLKKFNFGLLSSNELQHRTVQESNVSPNIIGDKEGKHVDYHDISFDEFITGQITQRISLKFGRPEVNRSADIDKEVLKIVELTLKTYDYKKVDLVELYNGFNAKRQVLTREAIWQGTAN